jgi:hypothetical protein
VWCLWRCEVRWIGVLIEGEKGGSWGAVGVGASRTSPWAGEATLKSPVASGLAVGNVGVCVGVMEFAVKCKHYTSEV